MAKKNVVPAKGAKLLRMVAKHILAEPRRYDQNQIISFGEAGTYYEDGSVYPACGTIACIGGWLEILTSKKKDKRDCIHTAMNFGRLAKLLGVTLEQLYCLTAYTHTTPYDGAEVVYVWPEKFRKAYEKAQTAKTRAKIANERIEYFIKTGL